MLFLRYTCMYEEHRKQNLEKKILCPPGVWEQDYVPFFMTWPGGEIE